jgi:hypothetical protein
MQFTPAVTVSPMPMNLRYFYTRVIATALVVLVVVTFGLRPLHAQIAGAGRSFVLTCPFITTPTIIGTPLARLLLTSSIASNVTITYNATGITEGLFLPANSSLEKSIDIPLIFLPEQEGLFRRTITITSSQPVTATLLYDRGFVSEEYAALPDSLVGFEYRMIAQGTDEDGSVAAIVGVHDATTVTITPVVATRSRPAGVPFTVTINRGDVYQVLTGRGIGTDLTSTYIVSNKPCGVISGSSCGVLNLGSDRSCNPLIEQLPAIDSWGNEYVLAPLWRQIEGVYRAVATCNNTSIDVGGRTIFLNRGEYEDLTGDKPVVVKASQPVMIAQFATRTLFSASDYDSAYGDPSMMMVAPRNQWSNEYSFVIPSMAPRTDKGGPVRWEAFVQITVDATTEGSLTIDDAAPQWIVRNVSGSYVVGIARVGIGQHNIRNVAPIGATVYGYTATDAYAFNPGIVRLAYSLQADSIFRVTCGDTYQTRLVVKNPDLAAQNVTSVEFVGDLDGQLLLPSTQQFTVPGQDEIQLDVELRRLLQGKNDGWLVLRGGACNQRLLAVRIQVYPDQLRLRPAFGSTIDFGGLPPTVPFIDTVVQLQNTGRAPLELKKGDIETGDFELVEPAVTDFPLIIQPGAFLPVKLRFRPSRAGTHTGRLAVFTKHCPDSQVVTLKGNQQSGGFIDNTTTPLAIRKLCGPKLDDTLRVRITNRGDLPLKISTGEVAGANAGEFQLLNGLSGKLINPNEVVPVEVRYMPFGLGIRDASLQIVSDALNRDTFLIPFSVRNDTLALELVSSSDSLDFGTLFRCATAPVLTFELRNTGTVDLASLSFGLNNPGQFELTPPLPGLLQTDSSRTFQLKLTGTVFGQITDTLHIGSDTCLSLDIPITGFREAAVVDFETDTIDFGSINYCTDLVELVRGVVNYTLTSRTIRLEYLPVTPGIEYVLPALPGTVPPGDTLPFTFRLRNGHDGPVMDSIKLVDVDCGTTMTMYIRADVDTARPQFPDNVDFGPVLVQSTSTRTATITNPTRSQLQVSSLTLGSTTPELQIVNPVPPVTIDPGESLLVALSYAPTTGGELLFDSLRIVTDLPCSDTVWAMIHGESVDDQRGVSLNWDTTQADIGAEVTMRLLWKQTSPVAAAEPLQLTTSLRYDATILHAFAVRSVAAGAALSNVAISRSGGEGRVELQMQGVFPDSGTVAEVRAVALLGDRDSTLLRFGPTAISFVTTGGPVRLMDTTSGIFRTTGICRIGPARLVRSMGMLRLAVANPLVGSQPATVEFETVEDGPTELLVVDQLGRQMGTLLYDTITAGAYSIVLDPSSLAAGMYWLVLRTPTQQLIRQLLLIQ